MHNIDHISSTNTSAIYGSPQSAQFGDRNAISQGHGGFVIVLRNCRALNHSAQAG